MGYHKKVDGVVYETNTAGNTFYHPDGREETFTMTDIWTGDKRLFEFYVSNDGIKLFKFDKKELESLGFKIESTMN